MNQKLQKILDIIQQADKLDAEQKDSLLKAVKDADKELEITTFKLERTEKVKKTTAILLEETIEELEQKRKAVEAQNRELEIESALERVRARTMAMQKSEELKDVIQLVYEQFIHLKITIEHTGFILDYKTRDDLHIWLADQREIPSEITIPCFDSLPNNRIREAKKKGENFFSYLLAFEEKNKFYQELFKYIPGVPEESLEYYFNCAGLAGSGVLLENVGLYIENFSGTPYTDEENSTLLRFGKVFQQTYTRFLDLQKAEEQTRESQIQASLERVRASAMAMHKSEELLDICEAMFNEFLSLGFDEIRNAIINIHNDKDNSFLNYDYAEAAGKSVNRFDNNVLPFVSDMMKISHSASDAFSETHIKDEALAKFIDLRKQTNQKDEPRLNRAESLYFYFYSIGIGAIGISTYGPINSGKKALLKRFRDVFNLSYKRYIDISNAEAQAREARIEASLEIIRSLALGMHKSEEVGTVTDRLFEELNKIIFKVIGCTVVVIDEDKDRWESWRARTKMAVKPFELASYKRSIEIMKKNVPGWFPKFYAGLGSKNSRLIEDMSGERRIQLLNSIAEQYEYSDNERARLLKVTPEKFTAHFLFFKLGYLAVITEEELPEENLTVTRRFVEVFDFAYTRFLDITRAEAQAREAQIEAALERVRSRTMAMQRSEELAETAADFFIQLNYLGIKPYRFNIAIVDEQDDKCQLWSTTNEGKVIPTGTFIPLTENDLFNQMYEDWKKQRNSIIKITGEKRIKWTEYIMKYVSFSEYRPENIDIEKLRSEAAIFSNFNFKQGFFVIHTTEDIDNKDLKILQRFANVFEQTYTRFLDLKQAEAQAKEAVKQASLDRVRAEIASMRTAEDLNRITPLIWRELTNLEVPFIRCGVFIVDEEQENVRVYLTTPDGKALGVLNLPFGSNNLTINTVAAWQKNEIYKENWNKEEFISWTKSMMELGQVQNAETYQGSSSPPESLHLHFVPFSQGMLYVGDTSPLSKDKLDLVRTLAESFSIAYARYEDFRNLEEAKNKIELTLSELKSAQAQLIHSEKMASLGELTAGIAHEIKNPLNFVNNFSEISGELLSELKEEIEKNDKEEVLALLEDLKQNLEKINLHGKRADSIVKGMLLHSRGTAGEKTLTDINDLLDQYVNLGYHGMRAQNKEFNITIEKEYDKSLGKINVVPQDISRVFLNLINNACYAAYDRKKNKSDNNFSPTLKVSTKNLKDKVEIRIGDNGSGIPKDNLGKIFQPFFTTKPTGEGTGLGLSLSYDIVTKVHNGELKVQTEEGVGTEFIIILNN